MNTRLSANVSRRRKERREHAKTSCLWTSVLFVVSFFSRFFSFRPSGLTGHSLTNVRKNTQSHRKWLTSLWSGNRLAVKVSWRGVQIDVCRTSSPVLSFSFILLDSCSMSFHWLHRLFLPCFFSYTWIDRGVVAHGQNGYFRLSAFFSLSLFPDFLFYFLWDPFTVWDAVWLPVRIGSHSFRDDFLSTGRWTTYAPHIRLSFSWLKGLFTADWELSSPESEPVFLREKPDWDPDLRITKGLTMSVNLAKYGSTTGDEDQECKSRSSPICLKLYGTGSLFPLPSVRFGGRGSTTGRGVRPWGRSQSRR